ncbi:MAG: hypothetical protein ACP5IZ_10670 [Thermoprotei archaeon]
MKKTTLRGISNTIAALILIAIATTTGIIAWYTITSTARNVAPKGINIILTPALQIPATDTTLLTITAQLTGDKKIFLGIGTNLIPNNLDALTPPVPCSGQDIKGLVYYTAVNLPPGTYTFTFGGDDGADVFINGPGLNGWTGLNGNFVWGPVSKSITLQGGVYEIAEVHVDNCGNGYSVFSGNLPVQQITWFIIAYRGYIPGGSWPNYDTVRTNPIALAAWGARVTGAITTKTTGSFNFAINWYSGVSGVPSIQGSDSLPVGLIDPGNLRTNSFIIYSGYYNVPQAFVGQTYVITATAYDTDGNAIYSLSASVVPSS